MSVSIYLSKPRYVEALKRVKNLIVKGVTLHACDDTTPGDKSTTCSWGLCSEAKDAWPDAVDHLWPLEFLRHNRRAPKYLQDGHICPIDSRDPATAKKDMNGCFHTCRVFKASRQNPTPSRETVIGWYDLRISELTAKGKS